MLSLGSFLVADWMARVLFDLGCSFSFISESFAVEIGNRPARLVFHFIVVTLLAEHSLAWKYLQSVGIMLGGMSFKASMIAMDMQEYNVILGIDWRMQHSARIDCAKKRVLVECSGEGMCFVQGARLGKPKFVISVMKAYRSLAKGRVGYLASVVVSSSSTLGVHDISIIYEYLDVFPEELVEVPPHRETEFLIDLVSGSGPISKAPYRMPSVDLWEFRK